MEEILEVVFPPMATLVEVKHHMGQEVKDNQAMGHLQAVLLGTMLLQLVQVSHQDTVHHLEGPVPQQDMGLHLVVLGALKYQDKIVKVYQSKCQTHSRGDSKD